MTVAGEPRCRDCGSTRLIAAQASDRECANCGGISFASEVVTPIQGSLIGVPQSARTSDDYYTPKAVFEALGVTFVLTDDWRLADTDDLRRYPAERPIAPQDSPKMAGDREVIQVAADNVMALFGEQTEDIIEDAAQATWPAGVDDYIDRMGDEATLKHNERVFAEICRAVAPLLIGAAEAAEARANA